MSGRNMLWVVQSGGILRTYLREEFSFWNRCDSCIATRIKEWWEKWSKVVDDIVSYPSLQDMTFYIGERVLGKSKNGYGRNSGRNIKITIARIWRALVPLMSCLSIFVTMVTWLNKDFLPWRRKFMGYFTLFQRQSPPLWAVSYPEAVFIPWMVSVLTGWSGGFSLKSRLSCHFFSHR